MTDFDGERDIHAGGDRRDAGYGPKAPKPLRQPVETGPEADSQQQAVPKREAAPQGEWISSPPVDWTTRPVGSGDAGEDTEPSRRGFATILVRDILIPLTVAVALVFGGLATVAKPYQIPTGSMEPTIQVNDRIIANRLVYHFKDIERGDIIVFNPPAAEGVDTSTPYVKRVIGLPGDTVAVEEGRTLVNGEEFTVEELIDPPYYTYKEQTVPEGHVFVLGDNRNSSMDSHRWGFLPIDNIIGRADVIYWPLDSIDWLG